jgi:NADH-quinone oxidoreductase subunit L
MENLYLTIVLAPLVGSIIAGFLGEPDRAVLGAHSVTILGVGLSLAAVPLCAQRFRGRYLAGHLMAPSTPG